MSEAELVRRLERLERDNRRLKRFGIAALVVAAALGTMAETQLVPNIIKAREFDVVDNSGQVRAAMGIQHGIPAVVIYGVQGNLRAAMAVDSSGAHIALADAQGHRQLMMDVDRSEPDIRLNDAQGYSMVLGSTEAAPPGTGKTHHKSAASIVMFGNDKKHHVIWEAPR